jgi:hypothetical protein
MTVFGLFDVTITAPDVGFNELIAYAFNVLR